MTSYAKPLFIVSGASRGLGKSLVSHIRGQGWACMTLGRSPSDTFQVDFSEPLQFGEIREQIKARIDTAFGETDVVVLVNNAAVMGTIAHIGHLGEREIYESGNVNFLMPLMLGNFVASLGRSYLIVNIISGAAYTHNEGLSLYSATKRGMISFFEIAKKETEGDPNCVDIVQFDPGVMDTDMQKELRKPSPYFKRYGEFEAMKQSGKLKKPDAVARELITKIEEILQHEKN